MQWLLCPVAYFTDKFGPSLIGIARTCLFMPTAGGIDEGVDVIRAMAGKPVTLVLYPDEGFEPGAYYNIDIVVEEF